MNDTEFAELRSRACSELARWARTDVTGEPTTRLKDILLSYYKAAHCDFGPSMADNISRRKIALQGLLISVMADLQRSEWRHIELHSDSLTACSDESRIAST